MLVPWCVPCWHLTCFSKWANTMHPLLQWSIEEGSKRDIVTPCECFISLVSSFFAQKMIWEYEEATWHLLRRSRNVELWRGVLWTYWKWQACSFVSQGKNGRVYWAGQTQHPGILSLNALGNRLVLLFFAGSSPFLFCVSCVYLFLIKKRHYLWH